MLLFLFSVSYRFQVGLHHLNHQRRDALHLALRLGRQPGLQVLGHPDAQLGVDFRHGNHSFGPLYPFEARLSNIFASSLRMLSNFATIDLPFPLRPV